MVSIEEMQAILASRPGPTTATVETYVHDLVVEVGDASWGMYLNPNKTKTSIDILAREAPWFDDVNFDAEGKPKPRSCRIWDVIGASDAAPDDETQAPHKTWGGPVTQRDGGQFIRVLDKPAPVTAASTRLPRLRVDGTRFVAGDRPLAIIDCTSFDLLVRLQAGDARWVDVLVASGFNCARIAVGTWYRMPRTHDDGLAFLPTGLDYLASRGLYANLTLCDSRDFRMARAEMLRITAQVGRIAHEHGNAIVGGWNEIGHGVQQPVLMDAGFLRELASVVPASVPFAVGSSHGGESAGRWNHGSVLAHHSDRGQSPEDNARHMAEAQRREVKPVMDEEPLGIAEYTRPGARVNDPAVAERQGLAARHHGLAGSTLHIDAGLTANVDRLGPIQHEAASRFVAAMKG